MLEEICFVKIGGAWQIAPFSALKINAITRHSTISQEIKQFLLKSHGPDNTVIFRKRGEAHDLQGELRMLLLTKKKVGGSVS